MAGGGWVATHLDVTEQQRSEAKIAHMAQHDALTDLPNRVLLRERLEHALAGTRARRTAAWRCSARSRPLQGDQRHARPSCRRRAAEGRRRRACAPASGRRPPSRGWAATSSPSSRTSTDPAVEAAALAERIQQALCAPFDLGDHQVVIGTEHRHRASRRATASIRRDPEECGPGALSRQERRARHASLLRAGDGPAACRRGATLERDLRSALVNGEFELYYQPFVNLERGEISGFEALCAGIIPSAAWCSPAEFIPLAEETGLIVPIGEWVLQDGVPEAATWPERHQDRGQSLAGAVQEHGAGAGGRAARSPPRDWRRIGSSSRSPSRCCMQDSDDAFATLRPARTSWACASRWTISAPAIRR